MTDHATKLIQQLRSAVLLPDGAGLTDGQLLECYLSCREEAAFAALVRRHGAMVWGVCRRIVCNHHDAEDAFQATFLVLVRKAASIIPQEKVANWLYGVAYQTALKARATATRRNRRERQAAQMPEPAAPPDNPWRDLQPVLDHALSRLPEKYRVPVVLCDLQGKTYREAARQLGCPEGTLSARLARARSMLARRLARHGVVLSSGSLAVALSGSAPASVPPALLVSTISAASRFAAGQALAASVISAPIAALTQGVLTAMFLSKFKVVMAVLLVTVVFVSGTGVMMSRGSAPEPQDKKSQTSASGPKTQAAPPTTGPAESDKGTGTANEIGNVYLTNAALADEKFAGKRVAITGKMQRIRATGASTEKGQVLYDLEMFSGAGDAHHLVFLKFRFTDDDRKQLAKLTVGQVLTIEGKPGRAHRVSKEEREIIIYFEDCKILKVGDWQPNP